MCASPRNTPLSATRRWPGTFPWPLSPIIGKTGNSNTRSNVNPQFVDDVKKVAEPTDTLLVTCRSGGRSAIADQYAREAGFTNAYNIVDGVEGDKVTDPESVFLRETDEERLEELGPLGLRLRSRENHHRGNHGLEGEPPQNGMTDGNETRMRHLGYHQPTDWNGTESSTFGLPHFCSHFACEVSSGTSRSDVATTRNDSIKHNKSIGTP